MRVTLHTCDGQQLEYSSGQDSFAEHGQIPCLRCGTCCTTWQPQLSADEVEEIATQLGKSLAAFYEECVVEHPDKPDIYLLRRSTGHCPFLEWEGQKTSCAIRLHALFSIEMTSSSLPVFRVSMALDLPKLTTTCFSMWKRTEHYPGNSP